MRTSTKRHCGCDGFVSSASCVDRCGSAAEAGGAAVAQAWKERRIGSQGTTSFSAVQRAADGMRVSTCREWTRAGVNGRAPP